MVKVTVKWEKESYDLDVDLTQPAAVFKAQLFTLTGVPVERQKIMGVKSAPLKVSCPAEIVVCFTADKTSLFINGASARPHLLQDDADMSAVGIKEVRLFCACIPNPPAAVHHGFERCGSARMYTSSADSQSASFFSPPGLQAHDARPRRGSRCA